MAESGTLLTTAGLDPAEASGTVPSSSSAAAGVDFASATPVARAHASYLGSHFEYGDFGVCGL